MDLVASLEFFAKLTLKLQMRICQHLRPARCPPAAVAAVRWRRARRAVLLQRPLVCELC